MICLLADEFWAFDKMSNPESSFKCYAVTPDWDEHSHQRGWLLYDYKSSAANYKISFRVFNLTTATISFDSWTSFSLTEIHEKICCYPTQHTDSQCLWGSVTAKKVHCFQSSILGFFVIMACKLVSASLGNYLTSIQWFEDHSKAGGLCWTSHRHCFRTLPEYAVDSCCRLELGLSHEAGEAQNNQLEATRS